MDKSRRILFIEDLEDDAELGRREVIRHGYEVDFERVETGRAMQAALARSNWDLIICDYSLPQFDAPSALRVLRDGGMISLSLRKACKYLREQSGKQFDPQVVEVFLREIVGK